MVKFLSELAPKSIAIIILSIVIVILIIVIIARNKRSDSQTSDDGRIQKQQMTH